MRLLLKPIILSSGHASISTERASALLELVIVLPVLLIVSGILIVMGSLIQQLFWFEQTSYNATLYSSALSNLSTPADRKNRAEAKAAMFSDAHRLEQKYQLLAFNDSQGISATPSNYVTTASPAPSDRFTSVQLKGTVNKLFLFSLPIKSSLYATPLLPAPIASSGVGFCGSNPTAANCLGSLSCCGVYTAGANPSTTTPCVNMTFSYRTCTGNGFFGVKQFATDD